MKFIQTNQWALQKKERNTWHVNLKDQYIDLNKLPENGILSSMILLFLLVLRKNLLINVYI